MTAATPDTAGEARELNWRRVLLCGEVLMWAIAAMACYLALAVFAPSSDRCVETNDQVVSSHAFVVTGWVCGLACLGAALFGVARRRGVGPRVLVGAFYLVGIIFVVVTVALHDNPCGF